MTGRGDEFADRLGRAQDRAIDRRALEASVRERLLSGAPRRVVRSDRPLWVAGGLAVVAAAAATAFFVARPEAPVELGARQGEVQLAVGAWIDAATEPAQVDFTDGTVVRLETGSSARIASMDRHGAHLVLERGSIDLDVVHTGDAAWQVKAGPFSVAVTGTAFQTRWEPGSDTFALQMRDGSVIVTGPGLGEGKRVSGTERLSFDLGQQRGEITLNAAPAPEATPEAAPAAPRHEPGTAEAPAAGPGWWDAVLDRDYPAAVSRARSEGLDEILAGAEAERLLGLADAAGLAGEPQVQSAGLEAVRRRFPGTEQAATAALWMGRTALDRDGAPAAAATWFQTAYDESSSPTTRMNALGLRVVALDAAGEARAAKQAAIEYLDAYPEGPLAFKARGLAPRKR